jgi:hypothetical protein
MPSIRTRYTENATDLRRVDVFLQYQRQKTLVITTDLHA